MEPDKMILCLYILFKLNNSFIPEQTEPLSSQIMWIKILFYHSFESEAISGRKINH